MCLPCALDRHGRRIARTPARPDSCPGELGCPRPKRTEVRRLTPIRTTLTEAGAGAPGITWGDRSALSGGPGGIMYLSRTRVTPPPIPAGFVPRPALVDALDN